MTIAIVTGANRGLGLETSKELAEKGFKVYMCCRDLEKGKIAAETLKSKGLNVEFVKLDITKTSEIRGFAEKLHALNEIPEVIVNNAGVILEPTDGEDAGIFNVDPIIFLKTIEVNTMGPLKLIQAFIPLMKERNSGRVINISSGMGALNKMSTIWPAYCMSKTSLNVITKILAEELEGTNISINSICPGWVRTDMGGQSATRSVKEGVTSTMWLATTKNPPSGKFIRDKEEIDW